MLKSIHTVTLCAADLDGVERAYTEWLEYRIVARGVIDASMSEALDAPACRDSRYLVMQPESGADCFLRAIERPTTAGYATLRHHGWNANEILVEDPAALALRLARPDSPFRIVGAPLPLESSPAVIAMQAIGPAGEMNYFTRIPPGGGIFIKTSAACFVDRTFIMVLGGPSLTKLQTFYRALGVNVTEAYPATVGVLQEVFSLSADTVTATALASLSPSFLVELDEVPPEATPRPRRSRDLPAGISLVTFRVDDLDRIDLQAIDRTWKVAPHRSELAPHRGMRVAMLEGAAGEWIELVETG